MADRAERALLLQELSAAWREMPKSAIKYDGPIDPIAPIDVLATETCRLTGYRPELVEIIEQTA